jgi:uncharacterized DUF497 family protein
VAITFDPSKREWTLKNRGLDFLDATDVFAGPKVDFEDKRRDYGEMRLVTVGLLRGRRVVVCWTPRGDDQHVFSMRKANDKEQKRYGPQLG